MVNQMYMKVLARLESVASTKAEKDAINAVRGRYVQQFGTDNEYVNSLSKLESVAATKSEQEQINTIRGKYGLFEMTYGVDNDETYSVGNDEDRLSDEIGTAMHVEPVSEKDIENSVTGEPDSESGEKTYEDFEDALVELNKLLANAPDTTDEFPRAVYEELNNQIKSDEYCPLRVRRIAENISDVMRPRNDAERMYIHALQEAVPVYTTPVLIRYIQKKISPNGKAFTWKQVEKRALIPSINVENMPILIDDAWYNLLTEHNMDKYQDAARHSGLPCLGFRVFIDHGRHEFALDSEEFAREFNSTNLAEFLTNYTESKYTKPEIYQAMDRSLNDYDRSAVRDRIATQNAKERAYEDEHPADVDYYETAWNHYKSPGNFDDTEPSGDDTAKKTRVSSTLYDYSNRDPENPFDESVNGKGKSV